MVLKTAGGKSVDLSKSSRFTTHASNAGSYAQVVLNQINGDMYRDHLKGKEQTILDIGGNVGLFSLWAHDQVEKIYAIEPTQSHVEVFQELLVLNGITNVNVVKGAIADKSGSLTLYENTNNTTMNCVVPSKHSTGIKETVPAYGLYDFIVQNKIEHIDFVKMDIEGSELVVIPSEQFKKAAQYIDRMFIEVHDFESGNFSRISENADRMATIIKNVGFIVERIGRDGIKCYR